MENTELEIGIGLFTQYYLFKFIQNEKPNPNRLFDFIDQNCEKLFPPTGFSFNSYLNELLNDHYIEKNSEGIISITNKGQLEFKELGKYSKQMEKFEKKLFQV